MKAMITKTAVGRNRVHFLVRLKYPREHLAAISRELTGLTANSNKYNHSKISKRHQMMIMLESKG